MTLAHKIAMMFVAVLLFTVIYGSVSLRHAFVAVRTHTRTTNSLINEACR